MKKNKPLPTIEILSERIIQYVELDIKCPDKITKEITEYGRSLILKDEQELFNYGFIKSLENGMKYLKRKGKAK